MGCLILSLHSELGLVYHLKRSCVRFLGLAGCGCHLYWRPDTCVHQYCHESAPIVGISTLGKKIRDHRHLVPTQACSLHGLSRFTFSINFLAVSDRADKVYTCRLKTLEI